MFIFQRLSSSFNTSIDNQRDLVRTTSFRTNRFLSSRHFPSSEMTLKKYITHYIEKV